MIFKVPQKEPIFFHANFVFAKTVECHFMSFNNGIFILNDVDHGVMNKKQRHIQISYSKLIIFRRSFND